MRPHAIVLLVLLLVIMLLLPTPSIQAEPGPGSGWWSSLYIQNVSSVSSTITSVALRALPSPTPQVEAFQAFQRRTDPVAPGYAIRLLPQEFWGWLLSGTFTVIPNDFEGSYLVNSTQPVSTVVDLTNRPILVDVFTYGISAGRAVGQYQLTPFSWAQDISPLYFPVVKRNTSDSYKTSTLLIQNAGTASAVAGIEYRCIDSITCTPSSPCSDSTPSIMPWTSAVIVPSNDVPAGKVCAAVVSAIGEHPSVPFTGLYTEHFVSEADATLLQTARALTDRDASTTLYAPVFKKALVEGSGTRSTGFYLMNTTGATVNVIGYFKGLGSSPDCSLGYRTGSQVQIKSYSTVIYAYPSNVPDGCRGTAMFVADGNIVGMVPESFTNTNQRGIQSATIYTMLPSPIATTKVMFPIYKEKVLETDWYRSSELTVQNTSTSNAATVYAVFKGIDGTQGIYTTNNLTIAARSSVTLTLVSDKPSSYWQNNYAMPPSGGSFAVTVYSIGGSPSPNIVGIAREASYYQYFYEGVEERYAYCYSQSPYSCPDRADYEGYNVP